MLVQPVDEWEATATLVTPDGRAHAIEIWATNKGNAGFRLADLMVRTHDSHDDGVLWDPRDLRVAFVDLDGDGASDLLLEGLALDTEKVRREPVLGEYLWDGAARRFEPRRVIGPRPPAW